MMSNGVSYARNILQFTENKEILNGYLVGLVDHYYQKMGWRTDLDTISDMDRQAMTLALGILKITKLLTCFIWDLKITFEDLIFFENFFQSI